jgi:hypothetical protein
MFEISRGVFNSRRRSDPKEDALDLRRHEAAAKTQERERERERQRQR